MNQRTAGLAILLGTLALVGVLVWIFHPAVDSGASRGNSAALPPSPSLPPAPAIASANPGHPALSPSAPAGSLPPLPTAFPAPKRAPVVPPPLPVDFPGDRAAARAVVEHVQYTIRDFRLAVGENPVGDNAEITRALLGDNRKQARFAIPEGSTVNGAGQLCDPWGTPYFFHALARDHMEVRSAGPDLKMWTADDLQQ